MTVEEAANWSMVNLGKKSLKNVNRLGFNGSCNDSELVKVMEEMMIHALEFGGYEIETQVRIGERLGRRQALADILAIKEILR